MAETSEVKTLNIKIMVDVKANKVVFAEADEQFVNFIITLMSLPLSSVTRLLLENGQGMAGSLGTLYNSIKSLDTQCFLNETYKDSVFKPRATVIVPALSLHELPVSACQHFQCKYCYRTNAGENTCPASKRPTLEIVRGGAFYLVTDSLEVKPMSVELIMSHAKEIGNLDSKQVQVGLQEGLAILKASMETSSVLTSVFLRSSKSRACDNATLSHIYFDTPSIVWNYKKARDTPGV